MGPNLSLQGKVLMVLSGIFIPTSSTFFIVKMSEIEAQSKKYFDLVTASEEHINHVKIDHLKRQRLFTIAPDHKFAEAYKKVIDMHFNKKQCYIKIKILGQDWKDIQNINTTKEKISVATGVNAVGTKKLEEFCLKQGMGSIMWLEQHRSSVDKRWRYWTIHTSVKDERGRNYRYWDWQK